MKTKLYGRTLTHWSAVVMAFAMGGVGGTDLHAANAPASTPSRQLEFNRDIRPILSDNCFACHGFDEKKRAAGLRLDTFEGATEKLQSGRSAIVPGKPEQSTLLARVTSHDPAAVMPPPETGKKLTPEQIELLRIWITQGAQYQNHWSLIPPKRPALPPVKNRAWVRNPVDQFILARLEAEGLQPSPEADKATLIRRVTYDLTGLPPTPEEIDAFLADKSPDAYEKLVDRLLASPRYGEHMARFWLDAARYGDTHALHLDNERSLWRWRDWVIDAYNNNMPFDQFTIEQLAGDLLPNPTLSQRIATGFNRNNPTTGEGGAIEQEFRTKYVVDRVNTTTTVWLGMSIACAECHDHKYDPITQKEYYQLFAFFNSTRDSGLDGNALAPPPFIKAPTPEQEKKLAELHAKIAKLEERRVAPNPTVDSAQRSWEQHLIPRLTKEWQVLNPESFTSRNGATLTKLDDHSILAGGANPATDIYEIVSRTDRTGITALRLEALTHESLPHNGPGRAVNANAVVSEIELEIAPANDPQNFRPVKFVTATADYSQPDFPASRLIDGVVNKNDGWAPHGHARRENRTIVLVPAEPFGFSEGTILRTRIRQETQHRHHTLGRVRLAVSTDPSRQPVAMSDWHMVGPFTGDSHPGAHNTDFGPEKGVNLNAKYNGKAWQPAPQYKDGQAHILSGGTYAVTYFYRTLTAVAPRRMTLSLGSDDSIKVWLNGELVHNNFTARGVAPDQDKVTVELRPGENHLLLKVVNNAGGFGFYFRGIEEETGLVPLEIASALMTAPDQRSQAQIEAVRDFYRRNHSPAYKKLLDELAALRQEEKAVQDAIPVTMVMEELPKPRPTHVLIRGQYDQFGERVEPGVPAALGSLPPDAPRNRLGLAQWLVHPENPLTARVTVNRYWARYFGNGIVKTVEDLGSQGEWPTHPELLDWLATEFIRTGWDVKAMQRLLVTSATYRQDARATPELLERDPDNRLLARGARFRYDAEVIRDTAMAVSGLLNEKIGGPSYKPAQPEGVWEAVSYPDSNTARFRQDRGDVLYRRSMYIFWKRTAPPPNLAALDAPDRESCIVQRSRTNTPLQALVLMNDPQFIEAARAFAQRIMTEGGRNSTEQIRWAFRVVTGRYPDADEVAVLKALYEQSLSKFRSDQEGALALVSVGDSQRNPSLDVTQLAAWTTVTNLLLGLDETVTRH